VLKWLPMQSHVAEEERTEFVAGVLLAIPSCNASAVPIGQLYGDWSLNSGWTESAIAAVITILEVFDVLDVTHERIKDELLVRAKSETAGYFLKSLADYIQTGNKLVANWEREGVGKHPERLVDLPSGPQFLYLVESIRTKHYGSLKPIRQAQVCVAIIKSVATGSNSTRYLVQYDADAGQYQLIGGRMRSTEKDAQITVQREIEEELAINNLVCGRDYVAKRLAPEITVETLSSTFGAYSRYRLTFFHVEFKVNQLKLGPQDLWVTLDELRRGKTNSDDTITGSASIGELDQQLPGGLDALPASLITAQRAHGKLWPWSRS
jgi:8-oxo-dGTP pyrophosphatase MutT (NUDIX family)